MNCVNGPSRVLTQRVRQFHRKLSKAIQRAKFRRENLLTVNREFIGRYHLLDRLQAAIRAERCWLNFSNEKLEEIFLSELGSAALPSNSGCLTSS